jgi:hypothetical protein
MPSASITLLACARVCESVRECARVCKSVREREREPIGWVLAGAGPWHAISSPELQWSHYLVTTGPVAHVQPAGMVVHISPGHSSGTLVNALLHHCGLGPLQVASGSQAPVGLTDQQQEGQEQQQQQAATQSAGECPKNPVASRAACSRCHAAPACMRSCFAPLCKQGQESVLSMLHAVGAVSAPH